MSETERGQAEHQDDQGLRADCYLFLAALLNEAPPQAQLDALAQLDTDGAQQDDIAVAWRSLASRAQHMTESSAADEFFALFVGLGRGELVPFGSWYVTGYLQEYPLSDLRDTLSQLALMREQGNTNTEDHIAQLLAVMATLIVNTELYSEQQQQAFFQQHLAPWAERFFNDLSSAKSAALYRGVGELGLAFIAFEKKYFGMPVE